MKSKLAKLLSIALIVILVVSVVGAPVYADKYEPVYVTDENGTTCTGDFDCLVSGQIIFYPSDLSESDTTYPVVVWANGTMCAPVLYYELLSEIASQGYIVVTNTDVMSGDGSSQIESLDYIFAENEDETSIFYNKVDTEHAAAAGHSQGGRSSVNAAAADTRFDCVLSIAGSNFTYEAKKLSTPVFFTTGTLDTIVMSDLWVKPAYNKCTGPAVYASLKGGLHTSCCLKPAAYSCYAVSWFDYWLKGDSSAIELFKENGSLSADSGWTSYRSKGLE